MATQTVPHDSHTFYFDCTFQYVHLHAKCELRFFCEAFSLVDSMKGSNVLYRFTKKINLTKGVLSVEDIIQILREENLLDEESAPVNDFHALLDAIYQTINTIINDKFVSCSRTSTLGVIAYEVSKLYTENAPESQEKSQAWHQLGERLQKLADYQQKHLRIHHDFQKSNYAPDPRTKNMYGSTFGIIILGFMYLLFTNCKMIEVRDFIRLFRK